MRNSSKIFMTKFVPKIKPFAQYCMCFFAPGAYRGREPFASEGCSPSYCRGEPVGTSLHPRQRTLRPRSSASSEKKKEMPRSRLVCDAEVKEIYTTFRHYWIKTYFICPYLFYVLQGCVIICISIYLSLVSSLGNT